MCRSYMTLRCTTKEQEIDLHLKTVIMIDPITRWIEVVQYVYKRAITIANLVGTSKIRYND